MRDFKNTLADSDDTFQVVISQAMEDLKTMPLADLVALALYDGEGNTFETQHPSGRVSVNTPEVVGSVIHLTDAVSLFVFLALQSEVGSDGAQANMADELLRRARSALREGTYDPKEFLPALKEVFPGLVA